MKRYEISVRVVEITGDAFPRMGYALAEVNEAELAAAIRSSPEEREFIPFAKRYLEPALMVAAIEVGVESK